MIVRIARVKVGNRQAPYATPGPAPNRRGRGRLRRHVLPFLCKRPAMAPRGVHAGDQAVIGAQR